MTVEIVEAATLGPGIAPVKREFLVVAAQVSSAQEPVVNDGSSAKRSAPDGADLQEDEGQGEKAQRTNGNNKNRKGMTKNRPKSVSRDSMELCRALLRGDPCLGGQECPSAGRTQVTHDIQAFLDAKGPDIGDSCPIFQSLGICRFGLGCRFAKSHTEPSTFTQIRDTAKIASESTAKEGTLNAVSMDLIKNVRSRKVDLPRSKAWATTSAAKKGPSIPEASATSSEAVKETEATTTNVEVSKDVVTDSPGNAYARHIGLDTDKDPDTRKKIDFRGKTYLAPLTTVGNLPFRRICKQFGVDVTCGEMVLANPLLQGQRQDWALLRRHPSEDLFGVQIAGGQAQAIGQTVEILSEHTTVDFIGKLLCFSSSRGLTMTGRSQSGMPD